MAAAQRPYQVKSCKIEYTFYSGLTSGTKTLIIDDSGAYEKEIVTTRVDTSAEDSLFGKESVGRPLLHSLIIQTVDSVFSADMDSMIAYKRLRFGMTPANGINNMELVGEDTFLGRKCIVKALSGFKLWYWKGIVLKKEYIVPEGGRIYEEATSLDENYLTKKDEFNLPKGLRIM